MLNMLLDVAEGCKFDLHRLLTKVQHVVIFVRSARLPEDFLDTSLVLVIS